MKRMNATVTYEPIFEPNVEHMPYRTIEPESITISCYENDVPAFIETEINRIYGSLYSSLAKFRVYSDGSDTSTYIVRQGGRIITAFLFQHHGSEVRVINEVINVEEQDISRFAAYIFANFISATVISFKSIQTNLRTLPFLYQRVKHLEDAVLSLPDTAEEYMVRLGMHTCRNIKHFTKKILDSFPTFSFEVFVNDQADEQTMRDVINLNRARTAGKIGVSASNEEETERIIRLATECGMVCVARIDGRLCAGSINFRVGSNYFLSVIAHDPMYDGYWLGILCCYFTICKCIAQGGKEFHFMWGECKYKYTLLGVKRDLDKVTIYRSVRQMLLNSDVVLNIAFRGYLRQLIVWLHKAKRRDSFE